MESYLTKPVDLQQFDAVVKSLRKYMLSDVILPSVREGRKKGGAGRATSCLCQHASQRYGRHHRLFQIGGICTLSLLTAGGHKVLRFARER